MTYCLPEHENHVCQVYSIESHGIQQSHHIMGGKTVHPGMISNFATGSLSSLFYHCYQIAEYANYAEYAEYEKYVE